MAHDAGIGTSPFYRTPETKLLFCARKRPQIRKQLVVSILRKLRVKLFRIQRQIPSLMDLGFDWQLLDGLRVVIPSDEKHVIVLPVVERRKQFFVVPFASLPIKRMFEGVPILALDLVQLRAVQVRVGFKHVTGERLATSLLCEVLDNLTATSCQAENGYGVRVLQVQRQCRS